MKTLVVVALSLLCVPALVDASKNVTCRGVSGGNGLTKCQLRPPQANRCTAGDVTGGIQRSFSVEDNVPPLCVTYVSKNNNDYTLYRGITPYSNTAQQPETCFQLCERLRQDGELIFFGCVKKTDGDFFNFGMPDNNENSEVLTYLPLNYAKFTCPVEVPSKPLAPNQSAAIGVLGAVIVAIVVGAIILYFGWIRSMPGSTAVPASAPPAATETAF